MAILRKAPGLQFQLQPELAAAFRGMPFLLERATGRQTLVIQMWAFGRYFLSFFRFYLFI